LTGSLDTGHFQLRSKPVPDPDLTSAVVAGLPMIKRYLKRLFIINKEAILMEVLSIKGLMQLLMKTRNTDEKWTKEERKEIKRHLKNIAKIIPALIIFFLPGGSFLLPILAEVLDRRKTRRLPGVDSGSALDRRYP
jgi:hypothetical protein